MKKSLFLSTVGSALAGMLLLSQVAVAEDLKIGIMVPTTGSEATSGKDMENAIKLAAMEINKAGGVLGMNIVTMTGDDACDPQQGTSAASKLVSAEVTGVVGGYCSGATLPTLKIYGDAGVPFVVAAANSTKLIGANQGNAFQVNSTGFDQVNTAIDLFSGKGISKLAIIHQESTFDFNARPPREKLLGVIPWKRPSDAYGYAQALESTWDRYQKETGRRWADRDDFGDAIDFVGWYTDKSQQVAGISKWDPYNQYLAYHEGQGGYMKKSYQYKGDLKKVARRVDHRAKEWGAQLSRCEEDLDTGWWIFGHVSQ